MCVFSVDGLAYVFPQILQRFDLDPNRPLGDELPVSGDPVNIHNNKINYWHYRFIKFGEIEIRLLIIFFFLRIIYCNIMKCSTQQ